MMRPVSGFQTGSGWRHRCGGRSADTITLAQAQEGKEYRVIGVAGGCGVQMRLASLGILPGQVIRILQSNAVGPVMIAAKDGRLALGRGVSNKLLLTPHTTTTKNDEPAKAKQD